MTDGSHGRAKRTGVLAHGCNLHTYQWKGIVWGTPPHDLGRVPKAVFVALYEDADALVFGTGASEDDGLLEADRTAKEMWDRFDDLQHFEAFRTFFPAIKQPEFRDKCREKVRSILEVENNSKNTREEVRAAFAVFNRRRVERVILVSSPTHLPRCLRDACAVVESEPEFAHFRDWLYATPSRTSFMGKTADDVAVFDPPHRPDRPYFNINDFLKRVNKVPGARTTDFLREFDKLLQKFDV